MFKISHLAAILILSVFLSGCSHPQVSFDVNTPGTNSGVFVIKDDEGKIVYSDNIKKGQLKLEPKILEREGYYNLTIADDSKRERPADYEIYLQPGNYKITLDTADKAIYPKIESSSVIQKELSYYYTTAGIASAVYKNRTSATLKHDKRLWAKAPGTTDQERLNEIKNLINNFIASGEPDFIEKGVIKHIITQNPNSLIAIHAMADMEFNKDATTFLNLYKTLSPEQRGTNEGKKLGAKLMRLAQLVPGQTAPLIAGTTPDGKKFNQTALDKKIYLLEFWRAGNEVSRLNHAPQEVNQMLQEIKHPEKFGMISISLDEKRDWWTSAIKDDKMTWTQYSDLKGNESPNAENWAIKRIPTYFIVDGNWHIIERDITKGEIPVIVNQYLSHH